MIFAPRRLLGETYEIRTGDMVMVAYLGPAHPGEEALSVIRVGLSLVAEAVGFLGGIRSFAFRAPAVRLRR